MAVLVAEIKCSNPDCNEKINLYFEEILYANSTYEADCPKCSKTTQFKGQAGLKYLGDTTGFVKPRELE